MRYRPIIWSAVIAALISVSLLGCWSSAAHIGHHSETRKIELHFHGQNDSGCCGITAGYHSGYHLLSKVSLASRLGFEFFESGATIAFYPFWSVLAVIILGGALAFYSLIIRKRLGSFVVLNYFIGFLAQGLLNPKVF